MEAAKLVNNTAHSNYWSPLTCLVNEQEEMESRTTTPTSKVMSVFTDTRPGNKVAAHWERKVENRRARKTGILDSGATSGAAPVEDKSSFKDLGQMSSKTFMLPDKRTHCATKKMLLKYEIRAGAREVNIVPGLHTTLISVPKFADADYITVFDKNKATIYDATTTNVRTTEPPVLTATRWDFGNSRWNHSSKRTTSMQFLIFPARAKPWLGTTQQPVFPQKKPSSTLSEPATTPRGPASLSG